MSFASLVLQLLLAVLNLFGRQQTTEAEDETARITAAADAADAGLSAGGVSTRPDPLDRDRP